MRLLLDTHVVLWAIDGKPQLKPSVRAALQGSNASLFLSLASLWEIGIKLARGRLMLPGGGMDYLLAFMERWRIELLPVTLGHVRAASLLPFHHGDPFDRMLIAQANTEGLGLVSNDAKVRLYDVDVFW